MNPTKVGLDNLKMVFKKNLRIRDNALRENHMGLMAVLAYHPKDTNCNAPIRGFYPSLIVSMLYKAPRPSAGTG
jgi:hypothetical protein